MDMQPVTSGCFAAVGYDPASQTMRLQFQSGAQHDYYGVAPEDHEALIGAPSLGRHFHQHIRPRFSHRFVPR
jgi:hypothetical protein